MNADYATLDRLWAEDFTVNNPFNTITSGTRGMVRTGALTYTSFLRVAETVLIRGDTVIVMGCERVVPKPPSPDAGKTIHRRFTNIWMKRSGARGGSQRATQASSRHPRPAPLRRNV